MGPRWITRYLELTVFNLGCIGICTAAAYLDEWTGTSRDIMVAFANAVELITLLLAAAGLPLLLVVYEPPSGIPRWRVFLATVANCTILTLLIWPNLLD